jgi:SAM-dependent methyltransferase
LPGPTEDALRDNQRLWDAWTKINYESAFYDVASFRDGRQPIRLSDYELAEVGEVAGRSLLHLQCHFGLDTLSWARLGATVTGIDFSPAAITTARMLADEVRLRATFVESAIYDLPSALDGAFDIVYTSKGVLGWLPDIGRWARVAAAYVKAGGFLYVTEIHPVALVFDDEDDVAAGELRLRYPYWEHAEPISLPVQGSYADPDAPTAPDLVEHGWGHGLGEIVSAVIDAGLRLDFLHEYDFVEWPVPWLVRSADGRYRLPPGSAGQLPLFFSLKATRPE